MRKLSKFEESLIRQMTEKEWYGNLNIPNLLDNYLTGLRIRIYKREKKVEILFEIQNKIPTELETKTIISRVGEINELIISTVNLINLLENEGYIIQFNSNTQDDNEITFGRGAVNLPSVSYTFPDNRTAELLVKYATTQIIVTQELQQYIKAGFKTREEIRHSQNMQLAWIGIGISILATIISLFFNVYDSFYKKDSPSCKCNSCLEIKTANKTCCSDSLKVKSIERKEINNQISDSTTKR